MNKEKYVAVFLSIVALSISAFALSMQTSQPSNASNAKPVQAQQRVPDHIIYGFFLRDLYTFRVKAEESERQGNRKSGEAYRNIYKVPAGWSAEEAQILDDIATECQRQLREIDAQAKTIIDERRALYYPDGKVQPGGQLAPPSPELERLQEKRNTTILQFRDRIRESLREQEFQKLEQFLKTNVAPTITVTAAPK